MAITGRLVWVTGMCSLVWVAEDKVLVFHCLGIPGDSGMEVHMLLLHLTEKKIHREQKIHLHSFCDSQMVADWWTQSFPRCQFSFNRSVSKFNEGQIAVLWEMEEARILIKRQPAGLPNIFQVLGQFSGISLFITISGIRQPVIFCIRARVSVLVIVVLVVF